MGAVAKGIAKGIAKRAKKSSSEHTKNKRPSTKGKHEKGQARKERDQGRASGKKQKGGKDGSKKRGKKWSWINKYDVALFTHWTQDVNWTYTNRSEARFRTFILRPLLGGNLLLNIVVFFIRKVKLLTPELTFILLLYVLFHLTNSFPAM